MSMTLALNIRRPQCSASTGHPIHVPRAPKDANSGTIRTHGAPECPLLPRTMLRNSIQMERKGSFHVTTHSTKERDQLLTLVMLEFNQQVLWQQSAKVPQARSVGLHHTNLRHPLPQS